MYQYSKDEINELMEYKRIFPDSLQIRVIYELVNDIDIKKRQRNEIINELAESRAISKDTIYYWQKKYQDYGVTGLLNAKEIIILFLEQSNKPLCYWNKRLLHEYVSKEIILHNISLQIEVSLTLCGNILHELKSKVKTDENVDYKSIYYNLKNNLDADFLYVDYFKMPNEPNSLTTKIDYCFILLSKSDLLIYKITVDRGKKLKYENEVIVACEQIIKNIGKSGNDGISCIIFKNTQRNKNIKEIYNLYYDNVKILVCDDLFLINKLKGWFKVLAKIKKELLDNPEIIKSTDQKKLFIEKNRLKVETANKL